MGVNLFALVNEGCDEQALIDELNTKWGCDGDDETDCDDPNYQFDWCDYFKGEGGHRLTVEQVLAFDNEAAPYFIWVDGELLNSSSERGDWREVVSAHKGKGPVLFIKARM